MIYLDNAASTRPSEAVIQTMIETVDIYGNPSSIHEEGNKAKKIITKASECISDIIGCEPDEIYYTNGATMANNVAIQGFVRSYKNPVLLILEIEHNDIMIMSNWISLNEGVIVEYLPVDKNGFVSIERLETYLKFYQGRDILVCIQGANGEIGTIQFIKDISDIVHKYSGAWLFSDLTQLAPYFHINMKDMGVDMASISGQKIHCIKGTGLLYKSNQINLEPIIFGEQGLIGGTENVIGINCLKTAFEGLKEFINNDVPVIADNRDYLISLFKDCGISLFGSPTYRLPNNVNVDLNGLNGMKVVELMSEFGYCVSSGSACSSGNESGSHVIMAITNDEVKAVSSMRITIDKETTKNDLDGFFNSFMVIQEMLR